MRVRPRSIRSRDTVIATVLAMLVLSAVAIGVDLIVRSAVKEQVLDKTQLAARRVSAGVRDGTLRAPIPEDARGVRLMQVVGPDGEVRNATPSAAGRGPISDFKPPPGARVHDFIECDPPRSAGPLPDCLVMEVIRVSTDPDSVVVYAGHPLPSLVTSGALELILALAVLALSALAAWVTWLMVGRTLRPVEAIRAQLAEISGSDLTRRVPQPGGCDEIAELARTANETLDRLEESVERQRQFAADASHELRTPIAGLRANLEDAVMHPADTDLEATIRAALGDTDRLESIVTDLLLLARLGTGGTAAREPVDLAELVRTEVAARTWKVKVRTDLEPGQVVCGVRMQLARLLANLLDNAERYAERLITVEVGREVGRDQNMVRLAVADDGPGIPAADHDRVFQRFTRLDSARSRSAGGTGLGLPIARDIAQAHGGTLDLEPHGRGARFVLRLPRETDGTAGRDGDHGSDGTDLGGAGEGATSIG